MERRVPTEKEVLAYLKEDLNWGRWGEDDQKGAVNMVTPEKRLAAVQTVRSGLAVSLCREFPKTPAPNNPTPAIHYMQLEGGDRGGCIDYYGISYHGTACTHLDALCHVWNEDGMWNGRDPDKVITTQGANWASIEHWKEGIITRGCSAGCAQAPGRALCHHGNPSTRLGVGRHRQGGRRRPGTGRCSRGLQWPGEMGRRRKSHLG